MHFSDTPRHCQKRSDVAISSPICRTLFGVGDGGFDLYFFRYSTSLRGARRRGNLLPPFAELCSAWGMVDSICIFAFGKNYCSHQFLNWWQQHATGMLHCYGFESHHHHTAKQKHQPLRLVFCFGGGWWIRTTEGIASRFTVCPLWPLGKSPI